VPSDDYFIFYNQPADPGSIVEYKGVAANRAVFTINLEGLLATEIEKCVFAATLDGFGPFKGVNGCKITASTSQSDVVYEVKDAGDETSLVFMELYRHQAWLKVRAIGKGFNGGLQPLAEAHGVSVAEEEVETASTSPAASAPVSGAASPASTASVPGSSAASPASMASDTVPSAASPASTAGAPAPATSASGAKQASVFASWQPSASVFASQQRTNSVFASQQSSASVFASLPLSDSVFASQPKKL
jgi:hypothetical protein